MHGTCEDNSFGPITNDCYRGWDFTLLFENAILSMIPSFLLLAAGFGRLIYLQGQIKLVLARRFQLFKAGAHLVYGMLQVALLASWSIHDTLRSWSSISAAALSLVTFAILLLLSYFEHGRNIKPSSTLLIYLFFSMIFDVTRTRTLFLIKPYSVLSVLSITSTAMKAFILGLESWEKAKYIQRPVCVPYGPEDTSSILNRGIFFWLNLLLLNGARSTLLPKDLYCLAQGMDADSLSSPFLTIWEKFNEKNQRYAIMRALTITLKWPIIMVILPRSILIGLTVCQPILLNKLLDYLAEPSSSKDKDIGYGLIGAYAFVYLGIAVSTGFYWYYHYRVLTMIRGCLVSAIGGKTLQLNTHSVEDPKAAVTLMSTDVERIIFGLRSFHEFWANAIQAGFLAFLLERQLGIAFVVPLVIAILSSVLSIWASRSSDVYQTTWTRVSQLRIGTVSNMLSSIKPLKMRGLTETLSSVIQNTRLQEITLANRFRMLLVWTTGLGYVPQFISPPLTFLLFILKAKGNGQSFDASRAFTSLSLLLILAQSLSQTLLDLPPLLASFGSSSRIDKFLSTKSRVDTRHFPTLSDELQDRTCEKPLHLNDSIVKVTNGFFGWKNNNDVLRGINIAIPRGKSTFVVGPVACGKSTLCHALLGETPKSRGKVEIFASTKDIGFCCQTPHLTNGTIQQNIIGCSVFQPSWYNTVVEACALMADINTMSNGHETMVGSDGINLSGGQKQKIAIARSLYALKPILLYDDVLSGLDPTGATHIVREVIGPTGLARQRGITVILATHATEFLPFADHVIVLNESGQVAQQGSFQSLRFQVGYIGNLAITENVPGKTVLSADQAPIKHLEPHTNNERSENSVPTRAPRDFRIYGYYFRAAGTWTSLLLLALVIFYTTLYNFPTYWLRIWVDSTNTSRLGRLDDLGYWAVYTGLQISALLLLLGVAYHTLIRFVSRAGSNLHKDILAVVVNAPLSFFGSTDIGVTINRFSQDIQLVDNELPMALLNWLLTVFLALGQVILIIISSPWVGFAFIIIVPVLYTMQNFYLRTSRQLRLLELEAKSPLYSSFLETLNGLSTLRAFGWTTQALEMNHRLLDESQKPLYLLYMIQRWLTFVLDVIVAFLAVIVVTLAVILKASGGLTGVALTQVLSLNLILTSIIIAWTALETSIGSVSRIKHFTNCTPSEHKSSEVIEPPLDWPHRGRVDINNITAYYESRPEFPALSNLNITIEEGQKIGICGRSGSGKSSLLLLLLRLLEIQDGSLAVDGLNLASLPRNIIRSRFNMISQELVFTPGTVRSNLDPNNRYSDNEVINALKKALLFDAISAQGGIDTEFQPNTLSHGQRQLFCLAGAILRKSRIVLLDEITSNVDQATDELMQKIVREEFKLCTVIAIAHRLNTIMDFDKVMVLDRGRIVESGSPRDLLTQDSIFKKMWKGGTRNDA
ncbi:canalicular multispecific organic anion transporter 1 [Nannizzia gypsea CBS 118893]|uniref:Canalicular multispecific organic anion transporter 1 n=1 Tax=Arthroderma gypseum (strain ATCC MYA-4604 / CBS 118893) TaxID=535722 RepID=E4V2B3_ARTGP|nr:canalicular multispecific organic anion transporter 1 [Nannizzia gypsea CBS 118893]EFR04178.1 canalicular multispecific organic anion transporter 1 [Nannizzia gypsea CBS 118893]